MKLAFPGTRAASRTISCDPSLAWDILSDYAGWSEWLPMVTTCTVSARETNFARADVELAGDGPGRCPGAGKCEFHWHASAPRG